MIALSLLSLAALAAGSPLSAGDYVRSTTLDSRLNPSEEELSNFKFYAEHSAAGYCNFDAPAGTQILCDGDCPTLEGNAATVDWSFEGQSTGIGAYVATDHARGEVVLSVRGSNNIRNFITDVNFFWRDCDLVSDCKLHTGFADCWDELRDGGAQDAIQAALDATGYRLVVTGHSLGGAVATIAGAYLRDAGLSTDIYSYGMPRAGNDAFAQFVTDQAGAEFRITHLADPVPRLPPMIFGYFHTSPEHWLSTGDSDTIDYGVGDIVVCEGIANVDCNAGQDVGLDIIAHLNYFLTMSACGGFPLLWKRQSDEELEQRLSEWQQQDMEMAAGMRLASSTHPM